ncbi:MAG: alpha/beta hydrolase [Chloroflexota bacterium]
MSQSSISITHRFIETNGIRLNVTEAGAEDAPLVILLHGFPEFWYGWHAQITFLAEHGYRVWAPDQRGYNLSDKPAGVKAYRVETLVQDVLSLIDASGQHTVYLVGHDWGAAVAWAVVLAAPERLKKLVILNVPHPTVFIDTLRRSPRQMLKSWYIAFFQLPRLPEALLGANHARRMVQALKSSGLPATFSDADIAEYVRAWTQPGALHAMINWYRAAVRFQPPKPADSRIRVPTLVIWGAQDVALTREMAQKSVDLCDDGRLVVFEEASHWVQHDQRDQVNELLAEFLQPDVPK